MTQHLPRTRPGHFLVVLFCMVSCLNVTGQTTWVQTNCPRSHKQAEVWYFGEKAGIDFRSGTATPLVDQNVMTAAKASASICDSLGNLLFFSDGKRVWDRTFTLMPNATGLVGDLGSTQPCIIVPSPTDSAIYYIFTTDILIFKDSVNYTTDGLAYTIIDLRLRNGLGDASSSILNVPLLTPVCQKLTAVRHRDTKTTWVIAHEWNSTKFYAYRVTGTGVSAPVVSSVGSFNGGNSKKLNNAVGYLKASPDGTRLASVITGDKLIEVFDFNNETGVVSNPKTYSVTLPVVSPYGVEFSPDCRLLYATILEIGGVNMPARPSFICQFDLTKNPLTPVLIDSVPGLRISAMQLATDGRIYLSRTQGQLSKKDSLDVIYNPNRAGADCNFDRLMNATGVGFSLAGRKNNYSLPNILQSFVNIPPFTWDSVCKGDLTRFRITNSANTDAANWEFGDGTTSTDFNPVHQYNAPGSYLVKLTETFNGKSFQDTMRVTYYPLPTITLEDTILLYKGSSINLHAGGGYMEYLWSTTSRDSVIKVASQGSYWADVKDFHCCKNSDTTFVKVFEYFIPNAFSPNGDGLNDYFKVFALYKNISYRMVVFDRWGQLVFETNDIDVGWDGTASGRDCPPGSYVWVVNIGFLGNDIITEGDIVKKGTVTIVR